MACAMSTKCDFSTHAYFLRYVLTDTAGVHVFNSMQMQKSVPNLWKNEKETLETFQPAIATGNVVVSFVKNGESLSQIIKLCRIRCAGKSLLQNM